MHRMRILLVNTGYYPNIIGGAEVYVQKVAEGLVQKGVEVYVLCNADTEMEEVINGVNVIRITNRDNFAKFPYKILNILRLINIFNKYLEKIQPDLINTSNLYKLTYFFWLCARHKKIPLVHTTHDYFLLKSGSIRNWLKKCLTKNVIALIVPSQYVKKRFNENCFFEHVLFNNVIYNAANCDMLRLEEIITIRKEKEKNENIKFAFLGRYEVYKGFNFIIDVFTKYQFKNAELHLFGGGKLEADIEKICNDNRNIYQRGFLNQEQLYKELLDIDVIIVPSLWEEPFGIVILDAYVNAIPVIVTNRGGMPELVLDGKTGLIVEPNEVEMVNAIKYFCNRENIISTYEELRQIAGKFDSDLQVKQIIELYKKVLNY